MQDRAVFLRQLHLLRIQDIEILHAYIVFLIEEAFSLDSCHIQNVEFRHRFFQPDNLIKGDVVLFQNVFPHIIRNSQLFRRDENKTDPGIPDQRRDQGVYGTPELQITAQSDGEILEPALDLADRRHIGQCLRRMLVPAVAGVYHRNGRVQRSDVRCAFFGMPYRGNVCKTGDDADGIRYAFSLRRRTGLSRRKANHLAPEVQHRCFEA